MKNRKGFILFVVITLLLALGILAFALNHFKSGAVTQLAKNIDQNRLILIAQSANTEVLALIRSRVNDAEIDNNNVLTSFRKVFPQEGGNPLNKGIKVYSDYEPPETLQLIKDSGYPIKVKTTATVNYFAKSKYASLSEYNGYLDIVSKAYIEKDEKNSIEVSQRQDVRSIDLRHNLDKYALFLTQFCPDLNNTQKQIFVGGAVDHYNGGYISRVYLGTDNYPNSSCPEEEKRIWLDLSYASMSENLKTEGANTINGKTVINNLFGKFEQSMFPNKPGSDKKFFYVNKIKFKDFNPFPNEDFFHVQPIKKAYEDFVNNAADACDGNSDKTERKTGAELKAKCEREMPKTNSNSAAYKICEDYVKNYRPSSNELDEDGNDYSNCAIFNKVLNTCIENWDYCYGYTDADRLWDFVDFKGRPEYIPKPQVWSTGLPFRGLTEKTDKNLQRGHFVNEYYGGYNPEEYQVGQMMGLYGYGEEHDEGTADKERDKFTPVIVEGNVWVRFFKVAFFDEFTTQIKLWTTEGNLHLDPVPIPFRRHNSDIQTFQNKPIDKNLAPTDFFIDNSLMSQPITQREEPSIQQLAVPVNALILGPDGNGPNYLDGDGKVKTLTKDEVYSNKFLYPAQKNPGEVPANKIGRKFDFDKVSYNYPSPKEFLEDRLNEDKNHLYLDGLMYIQKGDLDLTPETGSEMTFSGRGIIYIEKGNVKFGVFNKEEDKMWKDLCKFYLNDGDFILDNRGDSVVRASLISLYRPSNGTCDASHRGSLILNNNGAVTIWGNLVLDYLSTRGLDLGVKTYWNSHDISIAHDAVVMDPGSDFPGLDPPIKNSPYHISIGKIKTAYSIKAGGE